MANTKISDLTALTGANTAVGDQLEITDTDAAASRSITMQELFRGIPAGTVSLPGASFQADPNTGIYRIGADNIGVSVAGTKALDVAAGWVQVVSTDGGASQGPLLVTHRDSASPTAGDFIGRVDFNGEDSASNQERYACLIGQIDDPTSTSEDGTLLLQTVVAGTMTTQLDISSGGFVITPPVTITAGSITGITDLAVADGGTGVSTLTDGGLLVGSGAGAITALAVLADGEMIVGDGTTDPVAESGATLRTSIGVAIGSDVQAHSAVLDATTASFTTADETKLDGIEAAATADQTGAEIASALSGEAVTGLTNLESDVLTLKGYKAQAWEARFQINSGVIKHQIGAVGASTTAGSWHDKVLNASQSLTTTPNGADASTAFSGGAKISGTSSNILIFDTADQGAIADAFLLVATADYDTNGVNISFRAGFTSRDVDGVTIFRPEVQVRDDSGAAFNINTTNLATGADRVTMQFIGYLA